GIELRAPFSVAELARVHGGEPDAGLASRVVRRLVSPDRATDDDDLVVVTSPRATASASRAPGVLLCQTDVAERCPVGRGWWPGHGWFVVARLLGAREPAAPGGVDPRAWVEPGAQVDETATVRGGAVVLAGARIGAHAVVGEGAIVYGGS